MNKIFAIFLVILLSCKSAESEFYNHGKWTMSNGNNFSILKASPISVKETMYDIANEISLDSSKKLNSYTLCRFDTSGNIVYEERMRYDSAITKIQNLYDMNGAQTTIYNIWKRNRKYTEGSVPEDSLRTSDTIQKISKFLSPGKFMVSTYMNSNKNAEVSTITFTNNGEMMRLDKYRGGNDLDSDNIDKSEFYVFDNNRILEQKTTSVKSKMRFEYKVDYHYSKNGFLESFAELNSAGLYDSTKFVVNNLGDPVIAIHYNPSAKKDTTWSEYAYDKKGNWIKEVNKTRLKWINDTDTTIYTLTTRDIKY